MTILDFKHIDKTWTLFLDRDGVLNIEKDNSYIFNRAELQLYPYIPNALAFLSDKFGKIVLVTNQKGVGKGLMTEEDLYDIHQYLQEQVDAKINAIYFAPDLENDSPNRKPQPGMAFQAKKDFPEIDFSKSIMVGNRLSDMQFGRNAGMYTIFLATTHPDTPYPNPLIDLRYEDLQDFVDHLK